MIHTSVHGTYAYGQCSNYIPSSMSNISFNMSSCPTPVDFRSEGRLEGIDKINIAEDHNVDLPWYALDIRFVR